MSRGPAFSLRVWLYCSWSRWRSIHKLYISGLAVKLIMRLKKLIRNILVIKGLWISC